MAWRTLANCADSSLGSVLLQQRPSRPVDETLQSLAGLNSGEAMADGEDGGVTSP